MYHIPIWKVTLVRDGSAPSERKKIFNAASAAELLKPLYEGLDREQFSVILLAQNHTVIGVNVVSVGTLTECIVHPREVYKPAVVANAAAVIVAHNHPSGDPKPSKADSDITKRLAEAGELLGIRFLDSVILGDGSPYSFAEAGQL